MPRIITSILLFLVIIYAPLAYGCTTSMGIWGLDALLLLLVVSWLLQKFEERVRFSIPPFPALVVLLLALLAIAQVLNPHGIFDPKTWNLRPLDGLPILPRTVDRATSLTILPHLLILGAGFLAFVDLSQSRRIRWMIVRAVAISGLLVAVIGMVQKAAGADALLWKHLPPGSTFFAAFRYHGHASAFLNLCWPAALALFLRSCLERKYLGRNLWGLAWLFIFGALFVNTSKFGHAAAFPLLLLSGIVFFRHLPGDWFVPSWRNLLIATAVVTVLAVLTVPTLRQTVTNWQAHLNEGITLQLRQMTYSTCLAMVREVPLFGFGTGSFRILFPYYTQELGTQVKGIWSHAHEDYLETVIEWGWTGAALWACLFAPAVVRQIIRSLGPKADLTGSAALVGVLAILVHATVDFPLQIASIHFFFLIFLAFLWRSHRETDTRREEVRF